MDRRVLWKAGMGFVGVFAVGFAAATIQMPTSSGPGSSDEQGVSGLPSVASRDAGGDIVFQPPGEWVGVLLLVVLIAFSVAYFVSNTRNAITLSILVGVIVLFFVLGLGETKDAIPSPGNVTPEAPDKTMTAQNRSMAHPIDRSGAEDRGRVTLSPLWLTLLLLFAAVVTTSMLLHWERSPEFSEIFEPEDSDGDDDHAAESIGEVAGRAADRIESATAPVDNEVYRAWREMTMLLDVPSPETSTPGEFAAAADGIREDDVEELTRLFEEVRYGDMAPEPREELAVDILRRIEATYSEGVPGGNTEDVPGHGGRGRGSQ